MAEASAFGDPRFMPLSAEELDDINIEISVLSPLETASGPEEVMVGTHGIFITRGTRSGVLLPQVPVEQGVEQDRIPYPWMLQSRPSG